MLELAQECVKLKAFTHVSTAYVNSNIITNQKIEEKIYDQPNGSNDPDIIVRDILKMGPQTVTE